jgi:hypothetical protein
MATTPGKRANRKSEVPLRIDGMDKNGHIITVCCEKCAVALGWMTKEDLEDLPESNMSVWTDAEVEKRIKTASAQAKWERKFFRMSGPEGQAAIDAYLKSARKLSE